MEGTTRTTTSYAASKANEISLIIEGAAGTGVVTSPITETMHPLKKSKKQKRDRGSL